MQDEINYLLAEIYRYLKESETAYRVYLANGKTFKYAQALRVYNNGLRALLISKCSLLSQSMQEDAAALVSHYDTWTEKWDSHYRLLNPAPDDLFAFPNDATFPRAAARNIEREYERSLLN